MIRRERRLYEEEEGRKIEKIKMEIMSLGLY
jgi:hypothetical protein